MTNSWNGPQLGSPIRTDVPELQKKLIALLKQDPTSVANIPSGAKRLVNTSGVQWQVQQYNRSSWAAIGKLMHDVDKLDGYHAAITPTANTVAVRNANKQLEGDITGNAATASSAATLSETLPINKGGTGATTSADARTNLGAAPVAHASSAGTYGLATDANYGHVRSDGTTTKVAAGEIVVTDVAIGGDTADTASSRGQIGNVLLYSSFDDFNDMTESGIYLVSNQVSSSAANRPPTTSGGFLLVHCRRNTYVRQTYFVNNGNDIFTRWKGSSTWGEWNQVITNAITATTAAYGIAKLTSAVNSTSEVLAATAKAVKTAYDKAVAAYTLADGIDIATTAKAGIVRPSTGLTIDAAGLLKVALNNTVTSTSTAQAATANAAKVAYDKAVEALNKAASAVSSSGIVTLKGTRTTTGTWTITKLVVSKPLFILGSSSANNTGVSWVYMNAVSGTNDGLFGPAPSRYLLGCGSQNSSNVLIVVPTKTTVSFDMLRFEGNYSVRAYQ